MLSRRLQKFVDKNLGSDETLLYSAPLHWWYTVILVVFSPLVFSDLWMILHSPRSSVRRAYLVTNQTVVILKGLLELSAEVIPYDAIEDAGFHQSPIGRIFGYGTIAMRLKGRKGFFKMYGVPKPKAFAYAIEYARENVESDDSISEKR